MRVQRPPCHEQPPAISPASDRQGGVGAGAEGDAVAAGAGAAAGSTLSPEDGLIGSGALMTSKRSAK